MALIMLVDTSDYSNGSHHASCVHSFWSYSLVPCNIIINDSTPSQVVLMMLLPYKSTIKYSLASHPHSILQYQSLSVSGHRGRVWGLKTAMCEPVREFTIANEIAEHIIRVDFDTWARSFIPCDWHSGSSFSQARGNLEYDLKAWQHWAVVSFMKAFSLPASRDVASVIHGSACAMEWKLGMACKAMKIDRIR